MTGLIKGHGALDKARTLKHRTPVDSHSDNRPAEYSADSSVSKLARKNELEALFSEELEDIKQKAAVEAASDAETRVSVKLNANLEQEKAALEERYSEKQGKLEEVTGLLLRLITEFEQAQSDMREYAEKFAVLLTLESLEKICGERTIYQSMVKNTVADLLKRNDDSKRVRVRVSQQSDVQLDNLPKDINDAITLVSDPDLKAGDCLVESGFSTRDMSMMTQVDQIKSALIKAFLDR